MERRDEFAKAAMQAIISAHAGFKDDPALRQLTVDANWNNLNNNFNRIAEAAYSIADAMMREGSAKIPSA